MNEPATSIEGEIGTRTQQTVGEDRAARAAGVRNEKEVETIFLRHLRFDCADLPEQEAWAQEAFRNIPPAPAVLQEHYLVVQVSEII